jgi:hypothetical protein
MMQCRDIDELMMDHLYGELEADREDAFKAHVDGCARCQGEVAGLDRTRRAFAGLELSEPPAALTAKLLVEAARHAPRARESGFLAWLAGLMRPLAMHPAWAAAASILLVAGVAGMLALRGSFKTHAPMLERPMSAPARAETREQPGDVPLAPASAVAQEKVVSDGEADKLAGDDYRVPKKAQSKAKPKMPKGAKNGLEIAKGEDEGVLRGVATNQGGGQATFVPNLPVASGGRTGTETGTTANAPSPTGPPPAEPGVILDNKEETASADGDVWEDQASGGGSKTVSSQKASTPKPSPSSPVERMHREAQKLAKAGDCAGALKDRRTILRMDPDYYNRRVANDPSFAACDSAERERARNKDAEDPAPAAPATVK